jgi:hypothetical protein
VKFYKILFVVGIFFSILLIVVGLTPFDLPQSTYGYAYVFVGVLIFIYSVLNFLYLKIRRPQKLLANLFPTACICAAHFISVRLGGFLNDRIPLTEHETFSKNLIYGGTVLMILIMGLLGFNIGYKHAQQGGQKLFRFSSLGAVDAAPFTAALTLTESEWKFSPF